MRAQIGVSGHIVAGHGIAGVPRGKEKLDGGRASEAAPELMIHAFAVENCSSNRMFRDALVGHIGVALGGHVG